MLKLYLLSRQQRPQRPAKTQANQQPPALQRQQLWWRTDRQGPQIPRWSVLQLQRDTERWQPPPQDKQVNIKLSDRLWPSAVSHSLRDASDHGPFGVVWEAVRSFWIQVASCHTAFTSRCHTAVMSRTQQPVQPTVLQVFSFCTSLSELIWPWLVLMSCKFSHVSTRVCVWVCVCEDTPWLPVSNRVCVSLHLVVGSFLCVGFSHRGSTFLKM